MAINVSANNVIFKNSNVLLHVLPRHSHSELIETIIETIIRTCQMVFAGKDDLRILVTIQFRKISGMTQLREDFVRLWFIFSQLQDGKKAISSILKTSFCSWFPFLVGF